MISIHDAFAQAVIAREGEAGRAWLERLPALVAELCQRWNLEQDGDPIPGYLGLVIPVRQREDPLMLKVSWIDRSTEHEALALSTWQGRGAVQLVAARAEDGALLLERLESGRPLSDVPLAVFLDVTGGLLRRLAIVAPPGFPLLSDRAEELVETFPERWQRMGRPFPRRLLDRAVDHARQLGPVAGVLLVNYDLHGDNVLAGGREPWLAIDPKVVRGDPEYGLAQLLWTRLNKMEGEPGLERAFQTLVDRAQLEPDLARAWSLVRTLDYWLWALGVGLTEDPRRCAALANWLDRTSER